MGEIRLTRKGIFVSLGIIALLMYLVSGSWCRNGQRDVEPLTSALPTIYCITPTYARPVQKAELTRLSHVVRLVPNIFWVVVEDAEATSDLVRNILNRNRLTDRSVQLSQKTPTEFKQDKPNWQKPRGVEQRNLALAWVRKKMAMDPNHHAIVYFMDDDNTYSTQLFDEMAKIERGRVGVWPVGLVGGMLAEKPILNDVGLVTSFNAVWRPERDFPIDMAGFAISGDALTKHPEAKFSYEVERGYQETEILRHVTTRKELQPLANRLTQILVWHTRTELPKLKDEEKMQKENKPPSDQEMEI